MRILQINTWSYNGGSTGKIALDLKQQMENQGIESYMAYGFGYNTNSDDDNTFYRITSDTELFISKIWTKIIGHHGFDNKNETLRLIKWIDKIRPDLIHMHNIHGHYVNIQLLLSFIVNKNIPCVLTMHDCWTFTGHCAYFDYSECEKWITGCCNCPNLRNYPKTFSFVDPSSWNYRHKMALFAPLNITFVTPSQWLCNLQQKSFLKHHPCKLIYNGVDTRLFSPINSNVRTVLGIGSRKMILAVAANLEYRKGRDYLLELPKYLKEDEVLVVVGVQKGQKQLFLNNSKVIALYRTKDMDELIRLYSAADVFINPTLEDNFPTTNIEALACGTPVITFDTGGSGESLDAHTGIKVKKGDITELLSGIRYILERGKASYKEACLKRVKERFNKDIQYSKYIDLYKQILKS